MAKYIVLYDDGEMNVTTADSPQKLAIELFKSGAEAVIYEHTDGVAYYREYGQLMDSDGNYYDTSVHSLYSISQSRGIYDEQKQELILDADEEDNHGI